jgi:hypothetical protein
MLQLVGPVSSTNQTDKLKHVGHRYEGDFNAG